MATVYVQDNILMEYAAECGSTEAAKERIQEVIRKNSPGEREEEQ
jgi:hypothetical protein